MNERGRLLHVERDEQGILEVYEDSISRSLYFGNEHRQSSLSLHQPESLALHYTRCMLTALLFIPSPQKILMIGLGGGSLARFLLAHFPDCHITAVESRPAVVTVAHRFFRIPTADPRMQIIVGDGVAYIKNTDQPFDLILVDAFDPEGIHPGVCNEAFFSDIHRALSEPGIMSMNLWTTKSLPYKTTLMAISNVFRKNSLQLPLGHHSNLIALGLKGLPQPVPFKTLREPARELRKTLNIDFLGNLNSLQRHNTRFFSRLWGR